MCAISGLQSRQATRIWSATCVYLYETSKTIFFNQIFLVAQTYEMHGSCRIGLLITVK